MAQSRSEHTVRLARLLFLLLASVAAVSRDGAVETPFRPVRVVLLRHAEKATEPPADPPLSDAGRRRARALADLLGDGGVTALYSSNFARTRQTLEPLAERLGLTVQAVDPKNPDVTARAVLTHPGGVVAVAGHSNTVGPIIEALGGEKIPPIDEGDFDNLYLVTVYAPGKATVTRLRFRP